MTNEFKEPLLDIEGGNEGKNDVNYLSTDMGPIQQIQPNNINADVVTIQLPNGKIVNAKIIGNVVNNAPQQNNPLINDPLSMSYNNNNSGFFILKDNDAVLNKKLEIFNDNSIALKGESNDIRSLSELEYYIENTINDKIDGINRSNKSCMILGIVCICELIGFILFMTLYGASNANDKFIGIFLGGFLLGCLVIVTPFIGFAMLCSRDNPPCGNKNADKLLNDMWNTLINQEISVIKYSNSNMLQHIKYNLNYGSIISKNDARITVTLCDNICNINNIVFIELQEDNTAHLDTLKIYFTFGNNINNNETTKKKKRGFFGFGRKIEKIPVKVWRYIFDRMDPKIGVKELQKKRQKMNVIRNELISMISKHKIWANPTRSEFTKKYKEQF